MKLIILKKNIIFIIMAITTFIIFFSCYIYSSTVNNIKNPEIDLIELENIEIENKKKELAISKENFLIYKYKNKKVIALTFDDGPSEYTHILIDELKKREIHATFFVLGKSVFEDKETLKFIHQTGNEIGIHSYTHKLFTKLTNEEIQSQIDLTNTLLNDVINLNTQYIRVPYGTINERISSILKSNNLTNIYWTVDSKDWKLQNTNKIYNYTLKNIKSNEIILMHDTFKTSIEASLKLIDKLTANGYVFVTITEFMSLKNTLESNN